MAQRAFMLWVSQAAALHGSTARQHCMAALHGLGSWHVSRWQRCTAALHGLGSWHVLRWQRCTAALHGLGSWHVSSFARMTLRR